MLDDKAALARIKKSVNELKLCPNCVYPLDKGCCPICSINWKAYLRIVKQ